MCQTRARVAPADQPVAAQFLNPSPAEVATDGCNRRRRPHQGSDVTHRRARPVFLSDILPTGYMAAQNCNIQQGDTVAVWGCGPVGQFAIKSARLLGAERVVDSRWRGNTRRRRRSILDPRTSLIVCG